jgi:hypothetical protein
MFTWYPDHYKKAYTQYVLKRNNHQAPGCKMSQEKKEGENRVRKKKP